MPNRLFIFITAAFLCRIDILFSQENQALFIFEYSRGYCKNYFSKAQNNLANHHQLQLGRTIELSAERIIKGKYGFGAQLLHSETHCKNEGFTDESTIRLLSIPNMQLIATAEEFTLKQTRYLLSASYLLQKGPWYCQFKLGAGLGLTGYNFYKAGFISDSVQVVLGFGDEGQSHQYVIDCSKALVINSQLNLRYNVYSGKKINLSLFAALGYGFQRSRFEYIHQKWRYNVLPHQNSGTDSNQTLLIWRQNMQQLSLNAGISIILNKKVE